MSGDIDTYDEANKKTTSTLTIASATTDNGGIYKCTADFGGFPLTVESASATVSVYGRDCAPSSSLQLYRTREYLTNCS